MALREAASHVNTQYKELCSFPAIERDVACVAPADQSSADVLEFIRRLRLPNFEQVKLFDIFNYMLHGTVHRQPDIAENILFPVVSHTVRIHLFIGKSFIVLLITLFLFGSSRGDREFMHIHPQYNCRFARSIGRNSVCRSGTGTGNSGDQRIFAAFFRNRQKTFNKTVFFRKLHMDFADAVVLFDHIFCRGDGNLGFFEFLNTILPEQIKVIRSGQSGTDFFRFHRYAAIRRVGGEIVCPLSGLAARRSISTGLCHNKTGRIKFGRKSEGIVFCHIDHIRFAQLFTAGVIDSQSVSSGSELAAIFIQNCGGKIDRFANFPDFVGNRADLDGGGSKHHRQHQQQDR